MQLRGAREQTDSVGVPLMAPLPRNDRVARRKEDIGSAYRFICRTATISGRLETVSAFWGIRLLIRDNNTAWRYKSIDSLSGHELDIQTPSIVGVILRNCQQWYRGQRTWPRTTFNNW